MADGVSATIDTRASVKALKRLGKRAENPKKAFGSFHAAYNLKVAPEWNKSSVSKSSRYRGEVDWPALKPQYTRADGTVIPVWGKVNRAKGRGKVQAKLKGRGGKRYGKNDKQMVFTANLRKWWFTRRHDFEGKTTLVVGKGDSAPEYAAYQNSLRRFAFWKTPNDNRLLKAHFLRWVRRELVKKFGSVNG